VPQEASEIPANLPVMMWPKDMFNGFNQAYLCDIEAFHRFQSLTQTNVTINNFCQLDNDNNASSNS
jgi:hypothetical protein